MDIGTKDIYSEVYQILNMLGNEYIEKLPASLFNMLKEKRNIDYNPKYIIDIPLEQQNIKKETISIIALFHMDYWCGSENEKNEIKQILKNNEEEYQEELRKKYNPDNIFEKSIDLNNVKISEINRTELIEYKESILRRIINKIKHFLHRS